MKKREGNNLLRFWLLLLFVSVGLVLLYYLPEQIGTLEVKKIDMLSSLRKEDTAADSLVYEQYMSAAKSDTGMEKAKAEEPEGVRGVESEEEPVYPERKDLPEGETIPDIQEENVSIQPDSLKFFFDYSTDGRGLSGFFSTMKRTEKEGALRIAFCGDSFIEGDVFTGSVRELLHARLGGSGVGWLPMTSEVAGFRNTVQHRFKGWKDHSILHDSKQAYMLSGHCYRPNDGAMVEYRLPDKVEPYQKVSIYYKAETDSEVYINKDSMAVPLPATGSFLSLITLPMNSRHLKLSFSKPKGLMLYGVALDGDRGVVVDNYSLRGNAGFQLLGMNEQTASVYARVRPMDMIVLQYGLNVASSKQKDYGTYIKRMGKMIDYMRRVYPAATIVLMGVSDRAERSSDGSLRTMPGVLYLAQAQRELAQEKGVVYWDTLRAMGGPGSMIRFAQQGLAAKDYTHLGFAGGRVIARKFVESLEREKEYYDDF